MSLPSLAVSGGMRLLTHLGASTLAYRLTEQRLRILCYHGLWDVAGPHFGDKLFMSIGRFESRLQALHAMRCNVLPLAEGLGRLRSGTLPPRSVCITIDDGWATTFSLMLPLLEKYGFPATVYMRTDRMQDQNPISSVAVRCALELSPRRTVDQKALSRLLFDCSASGQRPINELIRTEPRYMLPFAPSIGDLFDSLSSDRLKDTLAKFFDIMGLDWAQFQDRRAFQLGTAKELRAADRAGFDIQLHTHTHELGSFDFDRISSEISKNRRMLSITLDRPELSFVHFCYPSGLYASRAFEALNALDIESATTTETGLATLSHHPLALPRLLDGERMTPPHFEALVSGVVSAFGPRERR